MNDEPENPWKQLARAARETSPAPPPPAAPPRVPEFRRRVMAVVHALLWRRVSLVIALLAALAWLVVFLWSRMEETKPTLIPLPPDAIQTPLTP